MLNKKYHEIHFDFICSFYSVYLNHPVFQISYMNLWDKDICKEKFLVLVYYYLVF